MARTEETPTETSNGKADGQSLPAPAPGAVVPVKKKGGKRRVLLLVLAIGLVAALIYGVPKLRYALAHASTDDATMNSHVTYLSARIDGVAQDVLVDDNEFVEEGKPLVRIDAEPYRVVVEQKRAALAQAKLAVDQQVAAWEVAKAELEQARSQAHAQLAGVRASGYLVSIAHDLVRYATASLQSSVANLNVQHANLRLAEEDYKRGQALPENVISREDLDRRKAAVDVARAQVASAEQGVQQSRALLGLRADEGEPGSVPGDLTNTFSGVQYAVASVEQSLAALGIGGLGTSQADELKQRATSMVENTVVEQSPSVLAAQARVRQAQSALGGKAFDAAHSYAQPSVVAAKKNLEEAELRLRYTTVDAPISGFVSRRSVNPGTHVQAGQSLLAIRPLNDVWVDANFKETQLGDLRIGQAVDLYVDAYPGHVFRGRVAGFSAGTGAVTSLLPPENATGNFVKVVQRLPVRIELTEPNSKETPLFAGLSVVPEVDIRSKPTGPAAGHRLRDAAPVPDHGPAAGSAR